jgi:hypothetical protein
MTLNNSRSVINLKIIRRTAIILFLAFVLLGYIAKVIKFPLLGINQIIWTLFVLVLFIAIMFLPALLKFQYIYFSDEGETIIFRYYTAGIIEGNKNSIEINKRTFSGFSMETRFLGLIKSLTLYQQLQQGVATYPPVYISSLKRDEREKIIKSLNLSAPRLKGKTARNMS